MLYHVVVVMYQYICAEVLHYCYAMYLCIICACMSHFCLCSCMCWRRCFIACVTNICASLEPARLLSLAAFCSPGACCCFARGCIRFEIALCCALKLTCVGPCCAVLCCECLERPLSGACCGS